MVITLYAGPLDGQEQRVGDHLPDVMVPFMPLITWGTIAEPEPRPMTLGRYSPSRPIRHDGAGRLIYDWRGEF